MKSIVSAQLPVAALTLLAGAAIYGSRRSNGRLDRISVYFASDFIRVEGLINEPVRGDQ